MIGTTYVSNFGRMLRLNKRAVESLKYLNIMALFLLITLRKQMCLMIIFTNSSRTFLVITWK